MTRYSERLDREGGFFLAESMGAMIFYLVMLAAGGILLVSLFSGSNLSETQQGLSTIRLQVRQLYTGAGGYTGLDTDLAVDSGLVPGQFVKDDGSVQSDWGAISIQEGTDPSTFEIQFDDVPDDVAAKFGTYQVGSWADVLVNDTSVVDAADMVGAINNNLAGDNTITFVSN